jgi:hypothetical protein
MDSVSSSPACQSGFSDQKPVRAAVAKEAGQEMSTEETTADPNRFYREYHLVNLLPLTIFWQKMN